MFKSSALSNFDHLDIEAITLRNALSWFPMDAIFVDHCAKDIKTRYELMASCKENEDVDLNDFAVHNRTIYYGDAAYLTYFN